MSTEHVTYLGPGARRQPEATPPETPAADAPLVAGRYEILRARVRAVRRA